MGARSQLERQGRVQKRREFAALGLAEFDPIAYIHLCLLEVRGTDEQLNRMSGVSRSATTFTPKQGQYLAFIYAYTRLHRRPPAEADMQQYFRVSAPSVPPNGACARTRRPHPATALAASERRQAAARKLKRVQILLAADAGASDEDIATSVGVGGSTVYRTKRRLVMGNLEGALSEEPRPGAVRKLSGKEEALLIP